MDLSPVGNTGFETRLAPNGYRPGVGCRAI